MWENITKISDPRIDRKRMCLGLKASPGIKPRSITPKSQIKTFLECVCQYVFRAYTLMYSMT